MQPGKTPFLGHSMSKRDTIGFANSGSAFEEEHDPAFVKFIVIYALDRGCSKSADHGHHEMK